MAGENTNRKINPFRKKRDSDTMTVPEENRMAIVGMIDEIEGLMAEIDELKQEVEELKCQLKSK